MAQTSSRTAPVDPLTGRPTNIPTGHVVTGPPVVIQPVAAQPGDAQAYVGNQAGPQAQDTRNLALEAASATGGIDPMTGHPYTPHKPADDTEQVYFEGSPMVRAVMGRGIGWCLLGLVIIAIPLVLYFLPGHLPGHHAWHLHLPVWFFLALAVIGVVVFMVPAIKAKTIRYKISNYRIDFERGWFSKSIDTMELWHVEDLRFNQSFMDRILGVGSITILSHDDTTPKLVLQGLPNPRPIFTALEQRVIAVKRQSGVIKTDSGL
jgi:membrane protein YdbS with pleckstrin-like domain